MRFKTPLWQIMCLVITVILHSARAQHDPISIEALCNNTMTKFEQNIMEQLQAQNKEVIEKLATHTTNVQQMADSIKNLGNITDNLLAGQLEIQKQLTKVTNDLQNSTHTQYKDVLETLADFVNSLRNITDNLLNPSQTDVGKQFANVKHESNQSSIDVIPSSCTMLNINETGIYYIRPAENVEPFMVLCDFEDNFNLGGGWTVFQRRIDGAVNFFQNWTMYKHGFGDVNGEHWLGLEKLHVMTRSGRHEMLVILEDHEGGSAFALYDSFQIGSEADKYMLTVDNYSGTAGNSLSYHNGMKFSTFDQDNDNEESSCAEDYSGAWWFNHCYYSHLNARYFGKGEHFKYSVVWSAWKGIKYSLKSSKMMVRRRSGR
uniref:Fibrinogen C-terminal domain-containing protein n=1 Tax=Anopheles atroparvus TaxID=41427 RepID=A0AAG5DMM2_ANOAO